MVHPDGMCRPISSSVSHAFSCGAVIAGMTTMSGIPRVPLEEHLGLLEVACVPVCEVGDDGEPGGGRRHGRRTRVAGG